MDSCENRKPLLQRVFVNIFRCMADFSDKICVVSSVLFIYINYDSISCYLCAIQRTKTTKLFIKGIKMMAYSLLINRDDSYSVCFVLPNFFFLVLRVFLLSLFVCLFMYRSTCTGNTSMKVIAWGTCTHAHR